MESQTFRYFSKVAGSKFVFPDGFEILFLHGFYDLKEEEHQEKFFVNNVQGHEPDPRNGKIKFGVYKAELDALIKAGNPLLYIQGTQPVPLPKPKDTRGREGTDANALSETELAQAEAKTVNVQGRVAGEVNRGGNMTDANASTVDVNLQRVVLADKPQSHFQKLREEAAARAAGTTHGGVANNS